VGAGFDAASIGTAAVQPPWGGGSAATDGALPAAPWQYDAAAPFSPSTPSATPVDGGAGAGIPAPADAGPAPTPPTPPTTAGAGPVLPPISGACPAFKTGTISAGGLSGISIQVGEKKPSGGSLIFYWHGTGSSAGEVNIMMPAAVRQEILAQGGIIVSPQSSLRTGGDCSGTSTFSKDDFKVADLIAACAVRDHNIDSRRIYTTGCSAGGLQAGCMASLRSSYVAAAVPNSGGITFRQTIQDPKHVPALMTMHGGASDWVAVSFSQTSKTLDTQFKQAGGFVVNCDHGGGHCRAPSALYSAGWEFMKSHPFGTSPSPYASGLTSSFPSYCKPF
jgi:predicted esterase